MNKSSWDFGTRFGALFLDKVVASPRGRAFLLSFMVNAEENDEGAFDELLGCIDLPDVHKMVSTHRDDEQRHAALLRGCLDRLGIAPEPIPPELRYIDRLDAATDGGFRKNFLAGQDPTGVMKVYAMLQIVEERGVDQFALIAHALRDLDPETSAVITRIVEDEKRHVLYAKAITRRYAPDAATLDRTLRDFRALEERAFADHTRAYFRFVVDRDLYAARAPERLFWRGAARLAA